MEERYIATLRPSLKNYLLWYFISVIFLLLAIITYTYSEEYSFAYGEEYLFLPFLILFFLCIFIPKLKQITQKYTVTTHQLEMRQGIISKKTSEISIKNIRNIKLNQGIGQRLLGIGDLFFASAGTGGVEIAFRGIPDPGGWKGKINRLIEEQGKE